MKKCLILSIIAIVFSACCIEDYSYYGYIVHKECIKHHMSNETPKVINEASLLSYVHVPYIPRPHRRAEPKYIPTEFAFYIGNKHGVYRHQVDSLNYLKFKCGDFVRFVNN